MQSARAACSRRMRYWDAVLSPSWSRWRSRRADPAGRPAGPPLGAIDMPRERGLARRETPLLGGLAILAGVVWRRRSGCRARSACPARAHAPRWAAPSTRGRSSPGACLIALVGAVDDIRDLPPLVKLIGQIAAAVIAVEAGAVVTDVTVPFIGALQFPNAGGVLTVIWLVGLMNVVNFSDGVDGLAAGRVHDRRRRLLDHRVRPGRQRARPMLAALTAGAALGFLFHNFHPASVFMGDSGANLLGYLLGVAAVVGLAEDERRRRPGRPAGDPRGAVPGHGLRGRQAAEVPPKAVVGRRQPLPPPDGADRLQPAQDRRLPVRAGRCCWPAWRSPLRLHPAPSPSHRRLDRVLMVLLGWCALAASVYLVYVLEILKFKGACGRELRRGDPRHERGTRSTAASSQDIETGEFERVRSRSRVVTRARASWPASAVGRAAHRRWPASRATRAASATSRRSWCAARAGRRRPGSCPSPPSRSASASVRRSPACCSRRSATCPSSSS